MRRGILAERTGDLLGLEESLLDEGTGTVALIEGAAGMGKTALLHAFAERVNERGTGFLGASASLAERDLPLSVAGQLFRGPGLTREEIGRADRFLADGALIAMAPGVGHDADAVVPVPPSILRGLSEIVLEAAERAPLVIGVDDVHFADVASLRFLTYLARRAESARVLVVLTECRRVARAHPLLHTDLLEQPGCVRIRLKPLSPQGIAEVVEDAAAIDAGDVARLTPEFFRVTGGNPALLHAALEDRRVCRPALPGGSAFGDCFRRAVLTCVHRSGAATSARGLAVLAGTTSPALLGELVHLDAESVALSRDVLRATGLLDGAWFRHDAVKTAVLSGMEPDERTTLQLDAAELLHGHGAPAPVIAERLMAADRAAAPWAVKVLQDAAEAALAEGAVPRAISCLRLAFQECADDAQRTAVHLDLVRAIWHNDPATAAGHLTELAGDLREGRLPRESAPRLARWALWLGRVDEALEIMTEVPRAAADPRPGNGFGSGSARWWFRYAYPGLAGPEVPGEPDAGMVTSRQYQVGALIAGALSRDSPEETRSTAEAILRETGPAFRDLTPVVAVLTLIYLDDLDAAERWCDASGRSSSRWSPLADALFLALRALLRHRRGDLQDAEKAARQAFVLLPPKGWGIAIGIPLGTLLLALTEMGRFEDVESHFDTPVPDAIFHTPLALPYLQARGRYYLGLDRPHAAQAEFAACGELAVRWGFDLPGFVSWRSDLAEARLAMGDHAEANRLAAEQLALLGPDQVRTRGMTLRVLAAAAGHTERVGTLTKAVELLEESGDRFALSKALGDLSDAYETVGEGPRAKAIGQRARLLAAECGVHEDWSARAPRLAENGDCAPGVPADPLAGLSDAERRVATLAANGHTNRQIAGRLHLSTSTVEQHLTRVYRKLEIRTRSDLPLKLLLLPIQDHPA
ncbi:AAA family ATPase [Amycolatopsis pittospori]|uniref:AAA family ATPase n=1 Tax=Amycolatopsis pittospori TaxID=2749434 RepID=UPI0015EFE769|nr:LuxR family transcriptional regulator [Amycolatopsis pittospori]